MDATTNASTTDTTTTAQSHSRSLRPQLFPVVGVAMLIAILSIVLCAEFLAPYSLHSGRSRIAYTPPQRLHFLDPTPNGKQLRLHTYGYQVGIDPATLQRVFERDLQQKIYIGFLIRGDSYRLPFGFESDLHLWGALEPEQRVHLLGTDWQGRDILSRMLFAIRHSLLLGTAVLVFCGSIGWFTALLIQRSRIGEVQLVQRVTQIIPRIPTWVFRIILLVLIARQWPILLFFVRSLFFVRGAIAQRTPVPLIPPSLMVALPYALLSLVVFGVVLLLLQRRLVLWLTLMWTTLTFWSTLKFFDLVSGGNGIETMFAVMGSISPATGLLWLAMVSVPFFAIRLLPGVLLVAWTIVLTTRRNEGNLWCRTGLPLLLFLMALLPQLYAFEGWHAAIFRLWHTFPLLGSATADFNFNMLEPIPWLMSYAVPSLILVLTITPLADRLLQRVK